jgi:hypothetical protein
MKAYLIITGTIFGLLAVWHVLMAIDERHSLTTDPEPFLGMAAMGALAAVLSVWAWRLLARQARS